MRLLATYRSTGLPAVMFEADGTGSVQYPNGNLWMTFTAETGKGALYSHSREVTQSWTPQAELSTPLELQLDQHLVQSTLTCAAKQTAAEGKDSLATWVVTHGTLCFECKMQLEGKWVLARRVVAYTA